MQDFAEPTKRFRYPNLPSTKVLRLPVYFIQKDLKIWNSRSPFTERKAEKFER